MKCIQCIIRPEKFEDVVKAVQNMVTGMTVAEVRGHGRQRGHSLIYRGLEYDVMLLPKVMIEIIADDNKVDDIVRTVIENARTGSIGDGRIYVQAVEEAYHVRTGFMDLD